MPAALAQHETRYAPGKIIVRFDPTGDVEPRVLVDLAEVLTQGRTVFFDEEFVPGFAAIRVEVGSELESIERVGGLPGVMYATRSAIAELASQPNDPWLPQQWRFQNTGQVVNQHTGATGIAGCDVCAIPAWTVRRNAFPVIIAVLDSGVNYLHADLKLNMWMNLFDPPGNGDEDNNGYVDDVYGIRINGCDDNYPPGDPFETFGYQHDPLYGGHHGTAVASFVGARGSNEIMGTGMAWTVQIVALAGWDRDAFGEFCGALDDSSIIVGFKYAWKHGAKLVNCSFGFSVDTPALYDAFSSLHDKGVIAAVSAHNHGIDIDNPATPPTLGLYPARYYFNTMIVIGASDECNRRSIWSPSSSSNWGAVSVDLFAPGSHLRTFDGNDACPAFNGTAPHYCGGTSFSTPLTSGVLALVWAQHPTWSAKDVVDHVIACTTPIGCLQGMCASGGILNAAKALGAICPNLGQCCSMPTGPC